MDDDEPGVSIEYNPTLTGKLKVHVNKNTKMSFSVPPKVFDQLRFGTISLSYCM